MARSPVAFILNQAKSAFYHAWGQTLESAGVPVYYISPSPRWTGWIRERGVDAARILPIHDLQRHWRPGAAGPGQEMLDSLHRAEAAGPLTVATAIQMDRTLNRWPRAQAFAYAAAVTHAIEAFVRDNGIGMVLAEVTWLVELFGAQAAAAAGARFFAPSTARIPSEQLLFFEGPLQRSYLRWQDAGETELELARTRLQDLIDNKPSPYYMQLATGRGDKARHFLSELKHHLSRPGENAADISVLPLRRRFANQLGQRWRSAHVRRSVAFETPSPDTAAPFVYLTLHKQPEASVDVLAAPYTNQFECIRALSRLIPAGWELWVKEHRSALGDRAPEWYRALAKLPGVRVISPQADGFAIMQRAALTVSPSGTASFEAGLLGRRGTCFAPMYFNAVSVPEALCPFSTSPEEFRSVLDSPPPSEAARAAFLADILANSIRGRIGDPIGDPGCVEPDNIAALTRAVVKVQDVLNGQPAGD